MATGTDDRNFVTVKFSGTRFDGGNLPVTLLDNIKAYQETLLSLAEEIWHEKNPEKKRLPKNFKKSLSLSFSRVVEGSAQAILVADTSVQASLPLENYSIDYLEQAQSRFVEVANDANDNSLKTGIPVTARPHLKRILSDLRENETLEFISHNRADQRRGSVRYSTKTRDALLERAIGSHSKQIEGLGIIRSLLDDTEEIGILSEHGSFMYPVTREDIRKGKYPIAAFVEFSLSAQVGANQQIKSVNEYYRLEMVPENKELLRLNNRLKELAELQEGWRDGLGSKMSLDSLRFASDISGFLCAFYEGIAAFPEIDGSVNIEFSHGSIEVLVMCRENYIKVEAFDDSDMEPVESSFFGMSPKLLKILSDLESFIS